MRKLLVLLVVLATLGVGADRVAARLVADEAERRLVAEGFTAPSVRMHGFPFLSQLAAREFDRVTVTSEALESGEGRARDVTAQLTGVDAPQVGPVRIGSLTARGTVPYDVVVRAAGPSSLRLSQGPGGQVEVSRTVDVAGQSLEVVAQARVQARGSRLRIVPTDLQIAGGGSIDDQLSALLVERVAFTYDIPDLPRGVRVERIVAAADGFLVYVSASALSVDAG